MIGRRCALVALGGLLIFVLSVNVYFIRMIVESSPQKTSTKGMPVSQLKPEQEQSISQAEQNLPVPRKSVVKDMADKIKEEIQILPSKYFKQNASYAIVLERLLAELRIMPNDHENIWNIPNNNVSISNFWQQTALVKINEKFQLLFVFKLKTLVKDYLFISCFNIFAMYTYDFLGVSYF